MEVSGGGPGKLMKTMHVKIVKNWERHSLRISEWHAVLGWNTRISKTYDHIGLSQKFNKCREKTCRVYQCNHRNGRSSSSQCGVFLCRRKTGWIRYVRHQRKPLFSPRKTRTSRIKLTKITYNISTEPTAPDMSTLPLFHNAPVLDSVGPNVYVAYPKKRWFVVGVTIIIILFLVKRSGPWVRPPPTRRMLTFAALLHRKWIATTTAYEHLSLLAVDRRLRKSCSNKKASKALLLNLIRGLALSHTWGHHLSIPLGFSHSAALFIFLHTLSSSKKIVVFPLIDGWIINKYFL